jgi:hypothetical protein
MDWKRHQGILLLSGNHGQAVTWPPIDIQYRYSPKVLSTGLNTGDIKLALFIIDIAMKGGLD